MQNNASQGRGGDKQKFDTCAPQHLDLTCLGRMEIEEPRERVGVVGREGTAILVKSALNFIIRSRIPYRQISCCTYYIDMVCKTTKSCC